MANGKRHDYSGRTGRSIALDRLGVLDYFSSPPAGSNNEEEYEKPKIFVPSYRVGWGMVVRSNRQGMLMSERNERRNAGARLVISTDVTSAYCASDGAAT
jgi:hypothetical protein